jgi:hypothetical protein
MHLSGRLSGDLLSGAFMPPEKNSITFHTNPLNDIAVIGNPTLLFEGQAGQHIVIDNFVPELMVAGEQDFLTSMSVCDFVGFPGYPEWFDKVEMRPIFRVGTIASDPSKNYNTDKPKGACVAYEAFSFGGSSGSPVFALQKGLAPGAGLTFDGFRPVKFVGINAGHLGGFSTAHSGLSYFYKSTAIVETFNFSNAAV